MTKDTKLTRGYVQHKEYHYMCCTKVLITNVYKTSTPIYIYIYYLRNVYKNYSLEGNTRSYTVEYPEIPHICSHKKHNFRDG